MTEFRKRFELAGRAPLEGMPGWMSELLLGRGIDTEEKADRFLNPSLEQLYEPEKMLCMKRAVRLIREAIRDERKILVYGDYDVDGISACTVMMDTLEEEGARVDFRIPKRHSEGYGLNLRAVEEAAEAGVNLLITVDCGISNIAEVRRAKELGMTVIVTDHHEIPEKLPPADAILDPLMKPEQVRELLEAEEPGSFEKAEAYPFKRLCGAGVALKIAQAMHGMEGVRRELEIAALATVADIVPLVDENRVIVSEGLKSLAVTIRPGLKALMENAGVKIPVKSDDIAYRLGPRLNAAGRLGDAVRGVELLRTRDRERAEALAAELEENNRERQNTEQKIISEALGMLPEQADLRKERAIILEGEDWNSGLIGLAAGKLCERFHHPTIVLSRQGDKAVGSCRSIPGVNIWKMLSLCGDLFLRFGGHEQAAGLTIPAANIPEFRTRLNRLIRENCEDSCFIPVKEYDGEMSLGEVTLETIDRLGAMEPTGFGNPAPVFLVRGAQVQEMRRVGKDHSHLKLSLFSGGEVRGGIGFGLGDEADKGLRKVDVIFTPERNEFNGIVSPQMQVQALRREQEIGEEKSREERNRRFFLSCLQEMSRLETNNTAHGSVSGGLRPEHLLKERLGEIRMSDEELREVYRGLRERLKKGGCGYGSLTELARAMNLSEERLMTALTAFGETRLADWELCPFSVKLVPNPRRCAMTDSPLIRYLRAGE